MSRDPLGSDPLGIDPVQIVQQAPRLATQRAISAYRQGIAVRGLYIADFHNPQPVGPTLGDDGQELTLEARQRIAAGRAPYDPTTFGRPNPRHTLPDGRTVTIDMGYDRDLTDHKVEPVGASAEAAIQAMPEIRIVTPKVLPPEPKADEPAP